jgi:hypothetical protein
MAVSFTVYLVIVGVIAAIAIIPYLFGKLKKKKEKGFWEYSFLLLIILLPINWYTPTILNVTDCGVYEKNVLIFPKSGYTMGRYNYITNNSTHNLALEYVVFGNVKETDVPQNVFIKSGELHCAKIVHIEYLFTEIPSSIRLKGNGAVRSALFCYDEELEELENSND